MYIALYIGDYIFYNYHLESLLLVGACVFIG